MRNAAAILTLLAMPLHAEFATQTDWSGGPEEPGPLTGFTDRFSSEIGSIWWEDGLLSLSQYFVCAFPGGFTDAVPGDVDGDGDPDMIVLDDFTDTISWWENTDGTGRAWAVHAIATVENYTYGIDCGDFDKDGDCDAVVGKPAVTWFENGSGGSGWSSHTIDYISPEYGSGSIDVSDIDHDGDPDLVGQLWWADEVVWWENPFPGTTWTRHTVDSTIERPLDAICGDFDGDGWEDIAAVFGAGDYTAWYRNTDGGDEWARYEIVNDAIGTILEAGDIDCDGDPDLLGAEGPGSYIRWRSNPDDLGEPWVGCDITAGFQGSSSACLADFDRDGDTDVVASGGYGLWVFENMNGAGTSWQVEILEQSNIFLNFPQAVVGCDLDSDGKAEFVVSDGTETNEWDPDDWLTIGNLVSSVVYVIDADWLGLSCTADTPIGTAVTFQVRASDDYTQMGEWSDTLTVPCSLDGILDDYDSFVQYRAILSRSEPGTTPVLEEVTFTWNPLGIAGDHPPALFELVPVPNPAHGEAFILLGMPVAGTVELTVYDLAGRQVSIRSGMELDAGWNEVALGEFPPGVYFVVARSGVSRASERLVVME
ncbi:MAG: FG-GAP-like repeat-containing protein [Candidatus Fermentibacter sp.]|nr:FG-GAP-like repeat-containing protein [Candidatus Fermentibacter sp.]